MAKKYPSKISYGLLTFVFMVFFAPLVPIVLAEGFTMSVLGLFLFLSLAFGFLLHLFLKIDYTIDGNMLHIQCGLLRFRPVAIDQMKEISQTNSLLSAPAPSFDRIGIRYGELGYLVISPKDKMKLATELTRINPAIQNHLTVK